MGQAQEVTHAAAFPADGQAGSRTAGVSNLYGGMWVDRWRPGEEANNCHRGHCCCRIWTTLEQQGWAAPVRWAVESAGSDAMRIWHQSFSDLDLVPLYRATLCRHAAQVLPPGDSVTLHGVRPGTYGQDFAPIHAIRHRYLEFVNEAQVCEAAMAAERTGYDAFALGCFYDPALRAARSLVDIPCVGLSETCMLVACSLGHRFGLVSLEGGQRAQHEELARAYGLKERLAGVVPMHPPIDEYMLEIGEEEARPLLDAFGEACRCLVEMGAEVVIPGDGFLNEFVWRHGMRTAHGGAVVMDALGTLFRYAGFMADARSALGLQVSRIGHYARPPPAMLAQARAAARLSDMREDEFSGGAEHAPGR
jgi:allantoin racemase